MKKSIKYLSENSVQTKKIGSELAKKILKEKSLKKTHSVRNQAIVVALVGDLGGGKTTFTQGFAKGLGIKGKITSPTFIIFRKHQLPNTSHQLRSFYHFDVYRIKSGKDLNVLEWKEIISNSQNVVLVEWADIIKKAVPRNAIWVAFKYIDKNKREIILN